MRTHHLASQNLQRNTQNLHKEHGPFSHIRKASAAPPRPPKPPPEDKKEGAKAPAERILYTDDFGEEFEVTADRKRKLQDVQSGLAILGLCPCLVHIWERNGAPLISAQPNQCTCGMRGNISNS